MAAKSRKPINTFLFENLSHLKGIRHFVSTRKGGASKPPFDTLNLSFNVSDDPKSVLRNRKLLAEALGINIESITTAKQVHNNKVAIITKEMRGRGANDQESALDGIDAMVTNVPGILLMIQVADCVPLLFYDPVKKVIAAAHAGWRGTVLKIASNTVKSMANKYRSDPHDIYVGIGPSIGPCCYEVDLWETNKRQLLDSGIPQSNIEVSRICTRCEKKTFFSYRAGKGVTGRFGAGIMLA